MTHTHPISEAGTKSSYDPVPSSDALINARRECRPLVGFPGILPETLSGAYAVQARSVGLWNDKLAGFKVGGIPKAYRNSYGGTWLAGPVFERDVRNVSQSGEGYVTVYDGGFAAYEAEYILLLSGLSSLETPINTLELAIDFVDAVHIGAEIASSPMALINEIGPGAIISDFGNNAGVVIGPEVPLNTLKRLQDIPVTVTIDGKRTGHGSANLGDDGPLGALRFFLNHIIDARNSIAIPDTLFLSSGAITGVHSSQAGTSALIRFGTFGEFTLKMVPRRPM